MLSSTIVDYFCGRMIETGKRRLGLTISILTNLGFLGFFKYFNFTFDNFNAFLSIFQIESDVLQSLPVIALPIGISFYTFQTMSYTIDVYYGNFKANRNFIDFATYVTMFPQLVAGPIVRYVDIQDQLRHRTICREDISLGLERFTRGLAKKVLLANPCGYMTDLIFEQNIADISPVYAWTGIVAYAFQIYFDFSGYSDMAIGLARIFGFDLLENFNYPYISKSIREFWRRWHISLSTWFRDYLYIPLGGNRKGNKRTYLNLFIVFFLTGLWHGAAWSFIFWGLFHGLFIIIERIGFNRVLQKIGNFWQHLYTVVIVLIGWVFFRADSITDSIVYLEKMFLWLPGNSSVISYLDYFLLTWKSFVVLFIAAFFSMPIKGVSRWLTILKNSPILRPLIYMSLFILSVIYLATDIYNPFIYFRF